MGFFDNLGKTITDAGQGAIRKGKEMADAAKYNSMISDEEKLISSAFEEIGRKYFEMKGDAPEEEFASAVEAIRQSQAKITEYQNALKQLKGTRKCPSCGAEVPSESSFCPVCGAKLEAGPIQSVQPVQEDVLHCSNCGATISAGSKFCTFCGTPVTDTTAEIITLGVLDSTDEFATESTEEDSL